MKRKVALTAGALALTLLGYVASQLFAQTAGVPGSREPRTRIALLNIQYVMKNYSKWKAFNEEIRAKIREYEARVVAKRQMIEKDTKDAQAPGLTNEQRDALGNQVKTLTREIEDINAEAKLALSKKSDEQMVIFYKEVQDAAQRYAVAHNFDMVFHFWDAYTEAELFAPANVARKFNATGLVPLFAPRELDISYEVLKALESAYATARPPVPAATAAPGTRPSGN